MASWQDLEAEAPDLVALARGFLDAHVHKTLATLRRDGSPRISGTEVQFGDGELWFGSMLGAVKARDLLRDARFALHSGSDDPPGWNGDAKVSGHAVEVTDPEIKAARRGGDEEQSSDDYHLFRADVAELAVVRLNESRDRLVIDSWHEGRGTSRLER